MLDSRDDILNAAFVLSLLVASTFFIPTNITGKMDVPGPDLNVSVAWKYDIEFTSFDFRSQIYLWEMQNITVEVTNTGSVGYNATMTTYIYNLTNTTILNLLSTYVDVTQMLHPGNSRGQRYYFAPSGEGDYFVRASVRYGTRVKEIWGAFSVTTHIQEPPPNQNQTNQSNQTNGTQEQPPPGGGGTAPPGGGGGGGGGSGQGGQPPGTGPGAPGTGSGAGTGTGNATNIVIVMPLPEPVIPAIPGMPLISIDYPDRIIVYRNISSLLNIRISNTGSTRIEGLMLYVSTPASFTTDINPKRFQTLVMGQNSTFLVSLLTDAPAGYYTLEFKFIAPGISKEGSVLIEVRDSPESLRDFIEKTIVNYEFLVSEISAETEGVATRGYDASVPSKFLLSAKAGLERARAYYGDKEYVKAFGELLNVEQDIKNAVFTLGNIAVRYYAAEQPTYLILIFLIPLMLFLLIIYRRRKGRRPRLLREAKEE